MGGNGRFGLIGLFGCDGLPRGAGLTTADGTCSGFHATGLPLRSHSVTTWTAPSQLPSTDHAFSFATKAT
jgi:hypothetical protein